MTEGAGFPLGRRKASAVDLVRRAQLCRQTKSPELYSFRGSVAGYVNSLSGKLFKILSKMEMN